MRMVRVGVISDTHGLLRPEALAQLQGCDHIIHGGDIGDPSILDELAAIAPLTVVRGNNDTAPWARNIPETARLDLGDVRIYIVHNIATLDIDPVAAGIDAVISGHSHRPTNELRSGILYLNPGSAGPRRFKLPVAMADLLVDGPSLTARLIELELGATR
jgi:uncharacterized protein